MSNIYSNHSSTLKAKQIKVRPIMADIQDNSTSSDESQEDTRNNVLADIEQAKEELQKIKEQQSTLVDQTNAQIEEAKENWKTEKQQYIEEAKETGYKEGFELGKQESLDQYKQLIKDANKIVESATKDYHSTIEQSEETILELAVHVAEKIIKKDLSSNPETFITIVNTAVREVKNQPKVSIFVHPDHYNLVMQQKEEISRLAGKETNLSIYVNEDLEEDSCFIEHPFGRIDCSIDTQLEELRKVLLESSMESSQ
ncbi:flagellar assembly protein FliH [Virgibacillus doumboii]|uniref:flagellar assembly protein FliH n=1 Tax=Virgibacillus doumboii TaxID=2697503 RepID=UPI0013DEE50C|nr:flagellar assembly protein FliH [Virgibacillus doumboii]